MSVCLSVHGCVPVLFTDPDVIWGSDVSCPWLCTVVRMYINLVAQCNYVCLSLCVHELTFRIKICYHIYTIVCRLYYTVVLMMLQILFKICADSDMLTISYIPCNFCAINIINRD